MVYFIELHPYLILVFFNLLDTIGCDVKKSFLFNYCHVLNKLGGKVLMKNVSSISDLK